MSLTRLADIEVVDPSTVQLRGYAAVTGNKFTQHGVFESTSYIIEPGAFEAVLGRLDGPLEIFWSHDTHALSGAQKIQVGQTIELREDDHGLYYEGELFNSQATAEMLTAIHGRGRIGASFGFDFGEREEDDDGVIHLLSFSKLHELGPTTWGANPRAYSEIVELASSEKKPELASAPVADIQPVGGQDWSAALWRATAELRSF